MGKENKTETKLAAARTRLILDKPFLGALVLRLPMVEADPQWCRTTATDARTFYYNREYIEQLTLEETQFMLAHEALHCGLSHFARRQHRVRGHGIDHHRHEGKRAHPTDMPPALGALGDQHVRPRIGRPPCLRNRARLVHH